MGKFMGQGVKLSDVLVAIAIVLPVGALVGTLLGLSSNRFGLSGSVRAGIIAAFTVVAGQLAGVIVRRRMKARTASSGPQG